MMGVSHMDERLVTHMRQHEAQSQDEQKKQMQKTDEEVRREFPKKSGELAATIPAGATMPQQNAAGPPQRQSETIVGQNSMVDDSSKGLASVAMECASAETGSGGLARTMKNVLGQSSPPSAIESLPETSASSVLLAGTTETLPLHELLPTGTAVDPPAEVTTAPNVLSPAEDATTSKVEPLAERDSPCKVPSSADDSTPFRVDALPEKATPCKDLRPTCPPKTSDAKSPKPLTRVQRGASRADDYIDRVNSSKEMKRINNSKTAGAIILEETDSKDPQVLASVYLSKAVLIHPLRWQSEDDADDHWQSEDNAMEFAFARLTAAYRHFVEGTRYCHGVEVPTDGALVNHEDFQIFRAVVQNAIEAGGLCTELRGSCQTLLSRQQALQDGDANGSVAEM
jgi:hypothetical protein